MRIPAAAVSLIVVAGVAMPPQAGANELGFYAGGHVGMASKEGDRALYEDYRSNIHAFFNYTPTTFESSFDETDTTYAVFIGYRFNRYLAVEGGYSDLGKIAYSSQSTGTFPNEPGSVNASVESETKGLQLSVLGILPLAHNWELFGRVGNLFATNRFSVAVTLRSEIFAQPNRGNLSDNFSQSSNEWFAGIGVSRTFFEIYNLRLEYQRFFEAGGPDTGGEGDLDTAVLGLAVTF